jgi:hypothetical protein
MARSILDPPYDVLSEQVGAILMRLAAPTNVREELIAHGFPLADWETRLRAAGAEMATHRTDHGSVVDVDVSMERDKRKAWTTRAAAWVKLLKRRLQYASLFTGRDLTVAIGAVRGALAEHQRSFPGVLRDLRNFLPVLRSQPELVPHLGAPDPRIDGEALLADGEALEPALTGSRADAREHRLKAEAARAKVILLLRELRRFLHIGVRNPDTVERHLFAEARAWHDGSGREPSRVKRPRRRKAPELTSGTPEDLSEGPTRTSASAGDLSEGPTSASEAQDDLSESSTEASRSPEEV